MNSRATKQPNTKLKLFRAKYVLPFSTFDRKRVISDGYVLVEGACIRELGKYTPEVGKQLKALYREHLGIVNPSGKKEDPVAMLDAVIMPSPKNGHTHFHESALTGRFRNDNLLAWLDHAVNPLSLWMFQMDEEMRTGKWADPSHKALAKRLGKSPYDIVFGKTLYDILKNGSGFVAVHHCNFTKYDGAVDAVVRILEAAKARAIVFPGSQNQYYQPDFLLDKNPQVAAARVRAQVLRHIDNKWARVMPGSDQFFSNSRSLLLELKYVARQLERELGVPIFYHVHSSENLGARNMLRAATGRTPIEHALSAGVLDEHTVVAHQVHTTAHDLKILKEYGVRIISNPTANGSLFSGTAPVHKFLQKGLLVAYSTDGSGSSDHQDLFVVMHVGVNMNRAYGRGRAGVITDHEALQMILVNPALIYELNADALEPDKDATLVVYDISPKRNPAMIPHSADSIFGKLVFCNPSGRNVTHSLSMGEWIVWNGEVVTMDGPTVLKDIAKLDTLYWNEVYPTLQVHMGTGKK